MWDWSKFIKTTQLQFPIWKRVLFFYWIVAWTRNMIHETTSRQISRAYILVKNNTKILNTNMNLWRKKEVISNVMFHSLLSYLFHVQYVITTFFLSFHRKEYTNTIKRNVYKVQTVPWNFCICVSEFIAVQLRHSDDASVSTSSSHQVAFWNIRFTCQYTYWDEFDHMKEKRETCVSTYISRRKECNRQNIIVACW